jgi:membrane-bound lytic murein transglycosylase D
MVSTGRRNLRIDDAVDERRDPYLATASAASVLKENYQVLGSWPLAVVAYNYGLNGMTRAVRKLGNQDLVKVLREHDGRAFGYAGRNFYPEFIAALELYRDRATEFPNVVPERPDNPRHLAVEHYVPLKALALTLGLDQDQLREHNPALLPTVLEGRRFVPSGYVLHLPPSYRWDAEKLYASLPSEARHDQQRRSSYTVRRGDTLARIAARFRTSVTELARINDLRAIHRIYPGQRLIVE